MIPSKVPDYVDEGEGYVERIMRALYYFRQTALIGPMRHRQDAHRLPRRPDRGHAALGDQLRSPDLRLRHVREVRGAGEGQLDRRDDSLVVQVRRDTLPGRGEHDEAGHRDQAQPRSSTREGTWCSTRRTTR